ncbi:MAG: hypothetical protein WD118_06615, partial [Phycisphaeraceae bacterium]
VAIAGHDDAGTLFGVSRYLEQLGFHFPVPGAREITPELNDSFVNPIYLLDWPSFRQRPLPAGGWQLRASTEPSEQVTSGGLETEVDPRVHLAQTAELIKSYAHQGKTTPPPIVVPDEQAELFTYVIGNLLWNPFLDTSRLIETFSP